MLLAMKTIEDFICIHACERPDHPAIIKDDKVISYHALWQRVSERARGYVPGRGYVLSNTQDIDFVIDYLSIHAAGAVAVPVASDLSADMLAQIHQTVDKTLPMEDGMEPLADILFTTGTTGTQKGVMISHRALLADAENLIAAQGYSPDTVFVICGPLQHIGSLSKMWPVFHEGGTLVLLDGLRDQEAFFRAFDYPSKCMATFLVPASIRLLLQWGRKEMASLADKIDFIETGAAPMPQGDLDLLRMILPHTRLYNTYASTETGIICTYDYQHHPCIAGCLGPSMKHSHVFITQKGTVACQGATLMSGYIGDPEATAQVLHDDTLWTSDLGELDTEGNLHLTGRLGDTINIGGYKIAPTDVENAAMAMKGMKDCICTKVDSPVFGLTLKLYYVSDQPLSKKEIARFLVQRLERWQVPNLYEKTDHIDRTFNGKLDRKKYM